MNEIEIVIRDYDSKMDDPYIYSTWTKYAWYSPKESIKIPKKKWFQEKIKEIKQILAQGETKVACIKNDPYTIMGYIVPHNRKLEWICVKKDFHHQGIENLLMQSIKDKIDELDGKDSSSINESIT